jgi:glycine hydroxymethyltransferase
VELEVDLDAFASLARQARPRVVVMGMSMTLFPLPVREMSDIIAEWGGQFVYNEAHQAGLIAGGQFQEPLNEGAVILTGSAGKTFSGPQSGIIVWHDPQLTRSIMDAIFPLLAATHQVNCVAVLAVAALDERGIPVMGTKHGYPALTRS